MSTRTRRVHAGRSAAIVAAAWCLVGCAGSGPPREQGAGVPTDHPRVTVLPFENLSGREEQGRRFTLAFVSTLAASGAVELVDVGETETMVEKLQIRATASPSREQLAALGESLRVRYALLGSVLESQTLRTPDGDTPTAGASLRLVETSTARIVWAAVRVKTGDEKETVFGWGREESADKLLTKLADEMLRPFQEAGAAWRKRTTTSEVTK